MTESGSVTLAACGDILLHGRYQEIAARGQAEGVFSRLAPVLEQADLTVGNLETVLTDGGEPRADKLCLRTDPVYARALAAAGFDILSLANNHAMDYGSEGLRDTRRHLRGAAIECLGAGMTRDEAARPLILARNGVRLGFIAACHESTRPAAVATAGAPGVAPLSEDALLAAVEDLAGTLDQVILLLHWGLEYAHYPTPEQVAFARRAIDRGAGAVLGHHSHALQGIETYKDGVIAYSLANLTDADLDWQGPTKTYRDRLREVDRESVLLRLCIDRERIAVLDRIPLWLDDDGRPTPAAGERARRIEQGLEEYSRRLADTDLDAFWKESLITSRIASPIQSWWRRGSLWDKIKGFRPGQLVTLYLLIRTYLQVRFSRSESKWLLFSSRNDVRPMPASQPDDKGEQ